MLTEKLDDLTIEQIERLFRLLDMYNPFNREYRIKKVNDSFFMIEG